eukprot:1985776-Prymnesium_polylepis.1
MQEAKIILASLLKSFRLEVADGQATVPDPVFSVTMSNDGGVNLRSWQSHPERVTWRGGLGAGARLQGRVFVSFDRLQTQNVH